MQTLIRRGVLALALVLGVSACTPQQMAAWLQDTGRPVPDDPANLQAQADVATAYWDAVVASLNAPPPAPAPSSSGGWPWGALVQCEAGGNWAANTGNGYSGGLQFVHSTWAAYGGQTYAAQAWQATAGQQIEVAQRIVASHGGSYRAWPGCRAKLGLP